MLNHVNQYLKGRAYSFKNAFKGLVYALETQKNAQIHFVATIVVMIVGFILKLSTIEFAIILLCIASVWVTEVLNTSIETLVDLCSPNYHHLARISKDLAAAAVLLAALFSVLIGIFVFIPHIVNLLSQ
jgi:diacylglycerol kinase